MTTFSKLLAATIAAILLSCGTSTSNTGNTAVQLIAKDTSNEIEKNNTLFVFVGEKIEITPIPLNQGGFENEVRAKYKVLETVYGSYDKDIIEFEAHDHYGTPEFTKYKTVLLFVSEYKGKFYQEKYMFDPLVKTKDGRWAGSYSSEYGHPYNKYTPVKPEKIDFAEEISFPIKITDTDGKELTFSYPEPYFKTTGDKAIAVYGNYIPELFKLRRDGVLTARELFAGKKEKELELSKDTTRDE